MKTTRIPAWILVSAVLMLTPAQAALDIDFGASIRSGDDRELYLAISSRYFDRERETVERYAARYADPDDLAVSFYLARCSRRSYDEIWALRSSGLTWWEISVRLRLPAEVWFVEVRHDPGPPYGKAYGYWRKHNRDRRQAFVLTDGDVRNLVALRMIHEYYDVPVEVAMEWRSSGHDLCAIMAGEYHKRHGKSAAHGHRTKKHPGKGHGKGRKK